MVSMLLQKYVLIGSLLFFYDSQLGLCIICNLKLELFIGFTLHGQDLVFCYATIPHDVGLR